MHEARQAQIGDVCARKDMVHEETRKLRMGSVLSLRSPACDGRLGAPTELSIGFIEWAPRLALAAHIQLEQFSQVMAESGSECGILPARAVAGTAETINAAVWPLLHLHVALELFQSLERDFERMPVQSAGLGVVVRGAGWQIAHCYGKPFEQPFSQCPHLHVQREPVENLFRHGFD